MVSFDLLLKEIQFFSNAKLKIDTCMDYTRPSIAQDWTNKKLVRRKNRDVKLRYTEITTRADENY
jgi:hypothetical protein